MLTIWSGIGDSLLEKLIDMGRQPGRMLVIVPEQYTLQAERELMDGLHLPGSFDLEVLSPSRLTEKVFSLAGADGREKIDARGKQLALARVLMTRKKKLLYYESAADKQGFMERMGRIIADFKRAGVTEEKLQSYIESFPPGATRDKLMDLARIYAGYEAQLSTQFVDGEGVLESMLLRLPDSGLIQGARVAIFGFDVLTEQMIRLILCCAQYSGDVQAFLVMEDEDIFAPVQVSAQRLLSAAAALSIPTEVKKARSQSSNQAPEIAFLSQHFLSPFGHAYTAPIPGLRLYAAPNPFFEAHFMAQEMLLLHEKGLPFGSMAVAMGDGNFAGTLATVLASYRIPAYVTRKLPATAHGAARFLLCSLRAVGENYQLSDMLGLIQSGYAPLSEMDCWQLENYILAYGIRGKLWLSPFARGPEDERAEAEEIRLRLMAPVQKLQDALWDAADVKASLLAIMDYLTETDIFKKLTANQEALLAQNMAAEAVQARQIWEAMMQLFSQAYALLDGVPASARQLAAWLEAGLAACELSSLPPVADAVMCGQVGSLPLTRPRALFLCNMTDGMLSGGPSSNLLTEEEQQHLQDELKVYLSQDQDGQDALALLDIWKALSAPREYLYLTRSLATQEGGALRPFSGLGAIRSLFPALVEEGRISQRCAAQLPLAPVPALDSLGAKMREGPLDGEWLSAWRYLSHAPETKEKAKALRLAFQPLQDAPPLSPEVTHQLYMERVLSTSRLESFAVCPYRHFVEQGLTPQERKEWTVTPIDAGNFYHSALEGFARLLPTLAGWPHITQKACNAAIDQASEKVFQKLLSGAMGENARARRTGEHYRQVLRRVAWTFTRTAQHSAFTPLGAEVRFGYPDTLPPIELTLDNGSHVFIRGIIDRIDRYEGDEGLYLRVIDYKSGHEKLDPARIFWGAQLQLLLYLHAALSVDEKALPAGAFYMHLGNPLIPDPGDLSKIEDALAKELRLKGIALRDAEILRLMDDGKPALSLPNALTSKGEFGSRAALATLDQMMDLIRQAENTAKKLAEGIFRGEIAASPLCDKYQRGPCDYCALASLCRSSASQAPEKARVMPDQTLEDIIAESQKK